MCREPMHNGENDTLPKWKPTLHDVQSGDVLSEDELLKRVSLPDNQVKTYLVFGEGINQRTVTVGGSITAQMVSSFTRWNSTASLRSNKNIFFYFLVKSSLVKLETNRAVITPMVNNILWKNVCYYFIVKNVLLMMKSNHVTCSIRLL